MSSTNHSECHNALLVEHKSNDNLLSEQQTDSSDSELANTIATDNIGSSDSESTNVIATENIGSSNSANAIEYESNGNLVSDQQVGVNLTGGDSNNSFDLEVNEGGNNSNQLGNFEVTLFTPASDLVTGNPGAQLEGVFARAGNDTIYAYDPGVSNVQNQNIDFLFGDIFDNSAEEFEIIQNIQNTGQGGNPLLILERDIPSVGADTFVLGDEKQPYYTDKSGNFIALLTTNFLGLNEFAVIYDFNSAQDTIRLNGKPEDYKLVDVNGLKVEGIEQPFFGKAIFSLQQGLPDLVAYVIERPEVKLDLNDKYFEYVSDTTNNKPAQNAIEQFGTIGIDQSLGAATDPSGNLYLTGSTSGSLEGSNQGLVDAWVAKYDSNGYELWGQQIGSSASESANAIATDKDGNFYLAGATGGDLFSTKQSESQDAWVAKYDGNGNLLWGEQFAVTGAFASPSLGLDVDKEGNVYLSGLGIKENQRTDIFNFPVQDDSWVAKFDSNGNQQWLTEIGSFFFDESYDLAVDKDGNSYITGWTQGLVRESDPSRGLLKYDAWLAKVDPSGQTEWIQQFGSGNEGLEFAWAVDTDSKGNAYATGWTTGNFGTNDENSNRSYDIWLTKYQPDGTQEWIKQFGTPGDDGTFLSDMEIDSQDNIYLIGYTNDQLGEGSKDEAYNAWVAKFDSEGNNKWIQQFGSQSRLDNPTGVTIDNDGSLYVTGFTDGSLGSNNAGSVDVWVAKFDAETGELQDFNCDSKDSISVDNPSIIPTFDMSNEIVTAEKPPCDNNHINPSEGIKTSSAVFDYGQFVSSLTGIFDPHAQNSFPTALAEAVHNGTIVI